MKHTAYPSPDSNQKSRLFFLEFLIVLFFFLIISTVCIRLFTHARRISDYAEALAQSQTAAASAAEILIAEQGDMAFLQQQYEPMLSSNVMTITEDSAEGISHFLIQITSADFSADTESLYELSLDLHTPLTRKEVMP